MLTDMTLEEEFEIKEEEPWYDKQDLEHDLHLAAELGKTLLDRNRELEAGLTQMCSTNREQLQEIEYLAKQVDLLRHVNDQHAKVYEQLDQSSRDMEQSNYRMGLDNRAAQQDIQELTETIEALQTQVEELQRQVQHLKITPAQPPRKPLTEAWRPHSAQSVSCLKELQLAHRYDPDHLSDDLFLHSDPSWDEVEQASLRRSVRSLQTQLGNERTKREEAEREADLLANENASLEHQLGVMKGCQARLVELEVETEELRQLWRADYASKATRPKVLMPDAAFLSADEESGVEEEEGGPSGGGSLRGSPGGQGSDRAGGQDHERSCARRSEVVKQRGISLLNEVDAQYSALQVKYDELLRRCHQGEPGQSQGERKTHKAVQTPTGAPSACQTSPSHCPAVGTQMEDCFQQPEYKALFKEIFTRIQKTKEELSENRGQPRLVE